jgi:HK97 gp10 family phage protein
VSSIESANLVRNLRRVVLELQPAVEATVDAEIKKLQSNTASLVPRRTGKLAELLVRDDAIEKTKVGGVITWRFGFLSKQAKREAWYWRFVEYGTRGYEKGTRRPAGVDKRGRLRDRAVKRFIPPRRAQPFVRPALILFKQAVARLDVRTMLQGRAPWYGGK